MAKGSEYQKHVDGGATVFSVTPAAGPKNHYLIFMAVVVILFGLAAPGGFKVFMLAVGGLAFAFGWVLDPRPKAYRIPSTFKVSSDAIEANGRTFAKDDIHRLLLRNGVTDTELLDEYVTTASEKARLVHRARAARVANGLTLEAGGKSTLLAGGMDETTAYGLLRETCRILGFDVN